MARGQSGRVVVELEPTLKKRLYSALAVDETTLKDWLIERIEKYIDNNEDKEGASR